jgi:hypothetical protein
MDASRLPPELERIEQLLANGPKSEPSSDLRQRVLGRIQSELHGDWLQVERKLDHRPHNGRKAIDFDAINRMHFDRILPKLQVVTAFAATLLIGLCVSFGMSRAREFALQQQDSSSSISIYDIAARLRQISPTLTVDESLRQARLRQIGDEVCVKTPLGEIPSEHELEPEAKPVP